MGLDSFSVTMTGPFLRRAEQVRLMKLDRFCTAEDAEGVYALHAAFAEIKAN